jgi:hypothetical protein
MRARPEGETDMKTRTILISFALAFSFAITLPAGQAGAQTIAGKWLGNADTPNGPVDLVFEIRQEGNQLTGTATLFETPTPISALRFDDGKFSGEITVMGGSYRLLATVNEGKMTGTWEQVGGDYKGTWTAAREAAAPASGIAGTWEIVAVTPDGDASYLLELNRQGDGFTGTIGGDMGTASLDALSFKDGKLHFEVDGGGTVYIIDGALEGDNLKGRWAISGGDASGTWSGKRKGAAAGSAAPAQASLGGTWEGSADTPDGTMSFQMLLQQNGDNLTGQIPMPDGTVTLQKVSFSGGKLVFEVDYMGGTYRFEATLDGLSLKGKWSSVDGSDSGSFTAQKKNP